MTKRWVPHDTRDAVVDFVRDWSSKTGILLDRFIRWLELPRGKFFDWQKRYGKANEHNALVPRDFWLLPEEEQAILNYNTKYPLEGYRRLAFMMLDDDIVAVSPSTVYRVLKKADRLSAWPRQKSLKGTGFVQPTKPHEHWHIDMAYLNLGGTFYYLCAILDGFSRKMVHWEIRETMTEQDVECITQRALEAYPGVKPRIISDNGPQFIAKDFKTFVRVAGLTHVRISPYYPQSNGKIERWNKTVKSEALRITPPRDIEDARRIVTNFVHHYNTKRLHSAIGYVAPEDKLTGNDTKILADRDRKIEEARERRRQLREATASAIVEAAA